MNRGIAVIVALLVATSAVGAAFGASAGTSTDVESSTNTGGETETATTAGGEAYAGTHVAFDVEGDAITDYRVGGEETFSSVAVQSKSEATADAGLGAEIDLETLTSLEAAGLSLAAQSETSAQVQAESGATLSAHDTERGTLVVESGSESQYVRAELAANATASDEGDDGDRVRVETDDHEGVFLVVGDGEVTVTDDGNVTAELAENATLAFRSYEDGERDETAEYEESLIADGQSAVEVHVENRSGEAVGEAVTYGQETSAEVETEARNQVNVTIDRAVHNGTVVLTTVSEEAVGSLEDLEVRIDGEAATEVSSKSELEGAIGSDESRYMVAQQAEASAEATVYIAVNHFSERTATIDGADSDDSNDSTDSDGTDDGSESDSTDDGTDSDGETDSTNDGTSSSDDSGTDEETDGTDGEETADGSETDADGETSDSGDDETDDSGGNDTGEDGGDGMPGFGVGVAVVAIAVAGLFARLED